MRRTLALAPLFLLAACQKPPTAPPMPPPTVSIAQPVRRPVIDWDEYTGHLEAVEYVEVRARVSGYLKEVRFKDGATVKKDDLLFVIDPGPYQAEVDRAEAEVRRAQTRVDLAKNDLERGDKLRASKAISEEEYDTRSKAKREADAALDIAQAAQAAAKLNLDYTKIAAPIAGRIGRRMVTEGNLITGGGGSMPLTTIVSQSPIYCYFDVDERSFLRYQELERQGNRDGDGAGGVNVELALEGESGFPHPGRIDFVDNRVDPSTGTIRIRGAFKNEDGRLVPGLYAHVRVPASARYEALLVRDVAVAADQDRQYVLVLGPDDKAEYRSVKPGQLVDGLRAVREGLKPDDWVIVNGMVKARPGAKVNARKVEMVPVEKKP